MNSFPALLIFSMAVGLTVAGCGCGKTQIPEASIQSTQQKCGCVKTAPLCPPCNPKAGCRIWRCPCTHDGFIMYPGNEPLNAPRQSYCPQCVSECDNLAIRCVYPYYQCDAEQVATYKCIEPIPDDYYADVAKAIADLEAIQAAEA